MMQQSSVVARRHFSMNLPVGFRGCGQQSRSLFRNLSSSFEESSILYRDKHLLAVNKPAGILSHGDRTGDIHIGTILKEYLKEISSIDGTPYITQVHRLDRPVSGAMVFALTGKACKILAKKFGDRSNSDVIKIYYAVVSGKLEGAGVADSMMVPQGGKNRRSKIVRCRYCNSYDEISENTVVEETEPSRDNNNLKRSITEWEAIHHSDCSAGQQTLVRLRNRTGRKHQIRVQLAFMNHPIIGDIKYGSKCVAEERQIALHAKILRIPHPASKPGEKANVIINAPFPQSWSAKYGKKAMKKAESDANAIIQKLKHDVQSMK